MGGSPQEGVQGLTLIEPVRFAVDLSTAVGDRAPRPTFAPNAADLAWGLHLFSANPPFGPAPDAIDLDRLLALARTPLTAHGAAFVGALAWNAALIELERSRSINLASLPADRRDLTRRTLQTAGELMARAREEAPYLSDHGYDFLRWHLHLRGNVVAPLNSPLRASDREEGVPLAPAALHDDPNGVSWTTAEPLTLRPVLSPPREVTTCLRAFLGRVMQLPERPPRDAVREVTLRLRVEAPGEIRGASLHQGTRVDDIDRDLTERLRVLAARRARVDCLADRDLAPLQGRELSVTLSPTWGR